MFSTLLCHRCGHCKNLAPEWALAGDTFLESDDVLIAAVDATASPKLSSEFGVKGYPTIKYFPKGSQKAEDYQGGRTAEDIVKLVHALLIFSVLNCSVYSLGG